jgi:fructokinase
MSTISNKIYGAIEAGGTKFVCAVGSGPDDLRALNRFATTAPGETIGKAIDFFRNEMKKGALSTLGIASFGPLDLNPASSTCGYITATPKAGWSNTNLAGLLRNALGIPVTIDTDVNVAALGEQKWGAARGLETFVYLTVGTGLGGGGIINGRPMHGLVHPEMGHMRIPHDLQVDPFPGACPFHSDCLEGLASGESIEKRWGKPPEDIPLDHPAWELEATYIALGIVNVICALSPQRIILGGGIMKKDGLLSLVRRKVPKLLNDYIRSSKIIEKIEDYIVPTGLGDLSGVCGAIALAEKAERYKHGNT